MSHSAHPLTMKMEMTGEGTGPTTDREIPVFGIFEAEQGLLSVRVLCQTGRALK